MGSDMYYYMEVKVDGLWRLCKKDGTRFDDTLTKDTFKPVDFRSYWGSEMDFYDMVEEISNQCEFEIPRNSVFYSFILGWGEKPKEFPVMDDVLWPQFDIKRGDIDESWIRYAERERDNFYSFQLTLQEMLEFLYVDVVSYESDGSSESFMDWYYEHYMLPIIEPMKKIEGDPNDIRIIMSHRQ